MSITVAQQMYHQTLRKDDKGSVVNKAKCVGAHLKNDFKYDMLETATTAAGLGAGYLIYKKPQIGVNAMKSVGNIATGLGKVLGKIKPKFITNIGKALEKHGTTIASKASKYGKIGALAAVAIGTISTLTALATKHAYNEGRIEQKYVDNAKIENMTGSVVV